MFTMFTTEEKTKARKTNLIEFFKNKGYKVDEPVNGRYKVHGFGGLYITDESCYFCFSSERGGNAIECLVNELKYSFKDAVNELLNYSTSVIDYKKNDKEKEKYIFCMPELNKNQHRAYAYLNKTRVIENSLITMLIKNKLLFQTKYCGNIVFPFRNFNNEIVGAEIVGTTNTKRFKKIDKNTDAFSSYWMQIGEPQKLFVFESPIDLLSFICLNENKKEYLNNSILLSMSGLKFSVVNEFINYFSPKQIYICVDNPKMSNEKDTVSIKNFMEHFKEPDSNYIIRLLPQNKDWNDDLKVSLQLS